MFSKTAKSSASSAAPTKFDANAAGQASDPVGARKTPPKAASLISEDITIEGSVAGEGELHIDGVVRGDVRIGKLSIGETGHVEGSIQAESAEVRGRVIGSLTAKQVRLHGTAYVDGDITHEQLSVESGAFFQGRSLKFQRPAAPAAIAAPETTPLLQPKSA
jgi:cytoskeletal protein CcmA (bactofilin family)